MDLDLSTVKLNPSPFNLQRLYLPNGICSSQELGKYASVVSNDSSSYLCRVFQDESLQRNCCLLEKSVQCMPGRPLSGNLLVNSINILHTVKIFKTVKVEIVLHNFEEAHAWRSNKIRYIALTKQLLRLFVFISGSTINLDDFEAAKKLGIKSIIIRDTGTPNPGKVATSTKVNLAGVVSSEKFSLRKTVESIEIPGCATAYEQLKDFFKFRTSLNGNKLATDYRFSQLMVIGPGGCGKKTLIQKVASESDAVLLRLECTRVSRPKPGDTEALIERTFDHAKSLSKEGLVVLLLRHLEIICHKPGRIVDLMNDLLDSVAQLPNLVVATPSSDPNKIHQSLKSGSRLSNVVYVGVPNEDDRADMLKVLCGNCLPLTEEMCRELARMTPGYVMADLSLIVNNAKRTILHDSDSLPKAEISFSAMKMTLSQVQPSALRGELGVVKSDFSITELGGLQDIKETLLQTVLWPLRHAVAFENLNINRSSGVLLYGPPGCAKTSLARAIAAGSNVTFLSVSAADLYSPFVGDTERTIASLFQRARAAAPSLLFIDEIDALVGNRDGGQKQAQERVLSSFLIEMDGIGPKTEAEFQQDPSESRVIVIAATNRPNVIDAALLRPGRLDKLIHVPPPDVHDRLDILRVITKRMPLNSNVDLQKIAQKTDLHSGADLSNLCREAALYAMTDRGVDTDEIRQDDFLTVLSSFEPSLNASMVQWYKDFSFS